MKFFQKVIIQDIINNVYTDYNFYDINENIDYRVKQGISEFIKKEQVNLFEIFSNRKILIKLIKFLKNVKKIKYVQIREFLDITRGTMESITRKIRENK